jgi:hypothetical protein
MQSLGTTTRYPRFMASMGVLLTAMLADTLVILLHWGTQAIVEDREGVRWP